MADERERLTGEGQPAREADDGSRIPHEDIS